jgi:hypothetical protein
VCSITGSPEPEQPRDLSVDEGDLDGRVTMSITFTADESFAWLNEVFGLVEGVMWAPMSDADPRWERWAISVYECVNEMPWIDDVQRTTRAPLRP